MDNAYKKSTNVSAQQTAIAVGKIRMFADNFVFYGLQVAHHFNTAADLIKHLLTEGILGLPIFAGFIHSKLIVQLESWKGFRNRTCCFNSLTKIDFNSIGNNNEYDTLLQCGLMLIR